MQLKSRKNTILIVSCIFIIIGIFLAGLWPLNFFQKNSVSWLHEKNGVALKQYGIIYSKNTIDRDIFKGNEISVELVLHTRRESGCRILSWYDTETGFEDLIIRQWKSHLIIHCRNSDSYNIEKYRKIGFRYLLPIDSTVVITITSDKTGSAVYFNGRPKRTDKNFTLASDNRLSGKQLIFGNAPTGVSHWIGDISGCAIYNVSLKKDQVLDNYKKWKENGTLSIQEDQVMLYRFDERSGTVINNTISSDYSLVIPERFCILKRNILTLSWKQFYFRRSTILDIFLNILGFIPLGFFLALYVSETKSTSKRTIYLTTLLSGFCVSLMIEFLQIYLPSRDSSLLDLLLNTAGAFLGISLLHFSLLFDGPYLVFGSGRKLR